MPTRTSNSIQPNGVLDSPTNKKKTEKKKFTGNYDYDPRVNESSVSLTSYRAYMTWCTFQTSHSILIAIVIIVGPLYHPSSTSLYIYITIVNLRINYVGCLLHAFKTSLFLSSSSSLARALISLFYSFPREITLDWKTSRYNVRKGELSGESSESEARKRRQKVMGFTLVDHRTSKTN